MTELTHKESGSIMKIVLISCVATKRKTKSKAIDMYISDWFRSAVKYAQFLCADRIYILSAKYGLLKCDDLIEDYNLTLNKMLKADRIEWSERVISKLRVETDMQNDHFVFLAGQRYRENLIKHINRENYSIPMSNLKFGQQKQFMKQALSSPKP